MSIPKKLKPLSPSLKEKKRYIQFEIISETRINDFDGAVNQINMQVLGFLGQFGYADAGVQIISEKSNSKKQIGVLRTAHTSVDKVNSALCLISQIESQPVIVRSTQVSGILKKLH